MTLSEFMAAHGLTRADMASRLGVSAEAVRLWQTGERMPTRENLIAIAEATAGAVMPNDFVDLPATSSPPAPSPGANAGGLSPVAAPGDGSSGVAVPHRVLAG